MKHKILPLLLAVLTGTALLTACSQDKNSATPKEAINRVYPEGEGKYYEPSAETSATAKETTPPATKETLSKAAESKKKALEERKATQATTEQTTAPATIAVTVPPDNITDDNINPNLDSIRSQVDKRIREQTLKSVSLSETSLTLEIGESRELQLSFDPEDALKKSCTMTKSNDNIAAEMSGTTIKVTGKTAGDCTVTVTSYNDHKVSCKVTVKPKETVITDDTPLPRKELCTSENVSRWLDAVTKRLESLGMTKNTALAGDGTEIKTADLPDNISYNTAERYILDKAESELKEQTKDNWKSFEFNCVSKSLGSGEYAVIIIINEKEEPSGE